MGSKVTKRGLGDGWWRLAIGIAGAAVLVAIAVSVWFAAPPRQSESRPPALIDAVGGALAALGQSEPEFQAARDELLEVLERRGSRAPPGAMATIQENLGIVDGAIVELARALERDPDNPRLARLLAATCRKELELLRQATELPATDESS